VKNGQNVQAEGREGGDRRDFKTIRYKKSGQMLAEEGQKKPRATREIKRRLAVR
jgi:hypothetical protein